MLNNKENNIMQSPFALMGSDPFFQSKFNYIFKEVDEKVIYRRRFARIQLRIYNKLSSSQSCDAIPITNKKYPNNFYNKNAGILMVNQKKPFNVRFNLDRNETY